MNQLVTLLKAARAKKDISQEEVGTAIGITQRAYAFYENGTRKPKWPRLKKIGEVLGIDEDVLWQAHSGAEHIVTKNGEREEQELTQSQVISILARSFERQSKATESQSETIKIQAGILEVIKKEMAREKTQARIESSLKTVIAGVRSLNKRQQAILDGTYRPQTPKQRTRSTSLGSGKNPDQSEEG